jgi:hypothetical protein
MGEGVHDIIIQQSTGSLEIRDRILLPNVFYMGFYGGANEA